MGKGKQPEVAGASSGVGGSSAYAVEVETKEKVRDGRRVPWWCEVGGMGATTAGDGGSWRSVIREQRAGGAATRGVVGRVGEEETGGEETLMMLAWVLGWV